MTLSHTHRAKVEDVALEPARRIVTALDRLAAHIRGAVCWELISDPSDTLSSIGQAMLDDEDRAEAMAELLYADVMIGDTEDVIAKLADAEPWGDIRSALEDIVAAWRRVNPKMRTAHDRRATEA